MLVNVCRGASRCVSRTLAALGLEDADGAVAALRDEEAAAGVAGDALDVVAVVLERLQLLALVEVPHAGAAVGRAGEQQGAVGRPGQIVDVLVAPELGQRTGAETSIAARSDAVPQAGDGRPHLLLDREKAERSEPDRSALTLSGTLSRSMKEPSSLPATLSFSYFQMKTRPSVGGSARVRS